MLAIVPQLFAYDVTACWPCATLGRPSFIHLSLSTPRAAHEPPAQPQAVEQVAFADRLLLNKIDLVSEEEKQDVRQRLKVRKPHSLSCSCKRCIACARSLLRTPWPGPASPISCLPSVHAKAGIPTPALPHRCRASAPPTQAINGAAEIIECAQARCDLDRVLGIRAFDLERILAEEPQFLEVGAA